LVTNGDLNIAPSSLKSRWSTGQTTGPTSGPDGKGGKGK